MRKARKSLSAPPTQTAQRQANHDDTSPAGVGLRTNTAAPPTHGGPINTSANPNPGEGANPTSEGDHRAHDGGVGDGTPSRSERDATFTSAQAASGAGAGAAEEGLGAAATRASATAVRSTPRHHYSAFSVPCRLVVKFTLCRSAATRGVGYPQEKRIYDVEVLGQHTLQQVMGEWRMTWECWIRCRTTPQCWVHIPIWFSMRTKNPALRGILHETPPLDVFALRVPPKCRFLRNGIVVSFACLSFRRSTVTTRASTIFCNCSRPRQHKVKLAIDQKCIPYSISLLQLKSIRSTLLCLLQLLPTYCPGYAVVSYIASAVYGEVSRCVRMGRR